MQVSDSSRIGQSGKCNSAASGRFDADVVAQLYAAPTMIRRMRHHGDPCEG